MKSWGVNRFSQSGDYSVAIIVSSNGVGSAVSNNLRVGITCFEAFAFYRGKCFEAFADIADMCVAAVIQYPTISEFMEALTRERGDVKVQNRVSTIQKTLYIRVLCRLWKQEVSMWPRNDIRV